MTNYSVEKSAHSKACMCRSDVEKCQERWKQGAGLIEGKPDVSKASLIGKMIEYCTSADSRSEANRLLYPSYC